jgi:uncharacterized membrane protein
MNLAHLHLLLNHFPTVGMIVGIALFAACLILRNDHLVRPSLLIFFGIAVLAIPTYVTGNSAQLAICKVQEQMTDPCKDPNVSRALIEAHEAAALPAFVVMIVNGAFAWLGLWQYRRSGRVPNSTRLVVMALSVIAFVLMARAANIGGNIRHPEIRDPVQTAANGQPLARAYGDFVQGIKSGSRWVWATLQTLHFIGMSLMFGVALVIDLRILGMMKALSFSVLHRLIPWAILGFGIDLLTGMSYFVGAPWQYATSTVFEVKVALIVLASVNVLYFTVEDRVWDVGAGEDAPFTAKAAAGSGIAIMLGILYCGHMLPFLGKAF